MKTPPCGQLSQAWTAERERAATVPEQKEETRDQFNPAERQPRGGGPIVNAPPIVLSIIAILIGIHGLIKMSGPDWEIWSLYAFALIPARFGGLESTPMIAGSQYWSLITYGFLHDGWLHVLLNSVWLLIFGTRVAQAFGALRFLAIALISTVGGALVMIAVYWSMFIVVVGASAGVSGLIAAAIPVMFGRAGAPLSFGELLRHRRAIIFMLVFLGVTLFTGVQGMPGFADDGRIAWEAHLGGFASGLLGYFIVRREGVQKR
jgi:membrane associated rhomboid family serine protease